MSNKKILVRLATLSLFFVSSVASAQKKADAKAPGKK